MFTFSDSHFSVLPVVTISLVFSHLPFVLELYSIPFNTLKKNPIQKASDVKSILSSSNKDRLVCPSSHMVNVREYLVSKHNQNNYGALVYRGAHGDIAGGDVRIVAKTGHEVYVA